MVAPRILIVDDDPSMLVMLRKTLAKNGYEIIAASDGLEALQVLKTSKPFDVLLTDLMMPRLSGMDLLQQARAMDELLEIVVITAAGSVESAITAMRDGGAYDYILKPFDTIGQVALVVERAIAHRDMKIERAAFQAKNETQARRLQALIANVGDAILAASADGMITVANPAASNLFGTKELIGQHVSAVFPIELGGIVTAWQTLWGDRPASLEIQWPENVFYLVSLNPLPEPEPIEPGWIMVLRETTALKRMDKLKTQAISDVITRLRMPLAEAMSAVVDLKLRVVQGDELANSLFRLASLWERIQVWGDDVLASVQRETGPRLQMVQIDSNRLLQEMQNDRLFTLYQQTGGKVIFEADMPLPPVHSDSKLVYQLLQTLIKRSTLRSPRDGEIRVQARKYQDHIWIEMKDSGPPSNDADMLLVADLSLGSNSTGMEMAKIKSILERLGGQLWVSNSEAPGSPIIVGLPILPVKVV